MRIAADIFKTLLQALTSIQYELFMVCSTLGSFSGLLFVTLPFRSFSLFKLELIFSSGGGEGAQSANSAVDVIQRHRRHARSTFPATSSPAGSHLRHPSRGPCPPSGGCV